MNGSDNEDEAPKRFRQLLDVGRLVRRKQPGLTTDEWTTVMFVACHPGRSLRDIQAELGLPQSTMSRVLAGLTETKEGRGLIRAQYDPELRRRLRLTLTPKGRRFVNDVAKVFEEQENKD